MIMWYGSLSSLGRFSLHLANWFYPRVLWFCFSFIPWDVWNWMLFLPVPELDFFSFYPCVIQSPAFPVCHSLSLLHYIFLSVSPFLFCITFSCLSLPFFSASHFPVCLSPSFLYHLILSHNIQYSTVCLTVTHTHTHTRTIYIYGVGWGGGMTHKLSWTLCEQLVQSSLSSCFFILRVLVTWYFRILRELCFYPRSVVKNKPLRKASAENLGTFMPTCFSSIFISFIYIYMGVHNCKCNFWG